MAYYVSAIEGRKRALLLGPFRRHGDALARVDEVRAWATANTSEGRWGGVGYGTAHHKTAHPAGALNGQLGITAGEYVGEEGTSWRSCD